MRILVTGAAGFIGFHTARRLLEDGHTVVGADSLNDYYDVELKQSRLHALSAYDRFHFHQAALERTEDVAGLFRDGEVEVVIHLAAQAGVRHSVTHPHAYIQSNIVAFTNVLEACVQHRIRHLLYASSSSVYGANAKMPYAEEDAADHPVNLYAATKKANELLAHSYSHLHGLPCTGLRFFTVYGPWGRPDMAYFKFTKSILENRTLQVYNHGKMKRDFTYIDDIVEGIARLLHLPPDSGSSGAPYQIYNIGSGRPEELMTLIRTLEELLGRMAELEYLPMQQGEMLATYADISKLQKAIDYRPSTSLREGLERFVDWYRGYYRE
ncbi:NAD-dependent epimerase [Cohnella pontilimi]|uniref:NAD-dependent epimerase n=1 Tax=Cohnella pontilimi TaxID=2564100 RepID=A0A4V5LSF5_9BACL|nr:NAD-dependent epimerase [Cohnella pontilimi]TJY42789.1 NAD-dependent epimerase [Cohnella pontilimi]